MSEGISVELQELIALKRFAQKTHYHPKKSAVQCGNHYSKLRGRGMDFAEVRNYQAGDEIRHMEWRVTARTGRPHVKLYQEERERPVVIVADFNPSMFFGTRLAFKSVVAARLASVIAWNAIKQGDRVGGLLFSAVDHQEFTPRGRVDAVLPLLAALSQYTKTPNNVDKVKPLSEVLLRVRRVMRPGSLLILISDFYNLDAECEKHLARLRAHNDVLAYHICDPLELAPPQPAHYAISNGKEELLLDTTNAHVMKDYQKYCETRLNTLQNQLQRLQTQYIQVQSESDLPLLVRQTFCRRVHV